MTVQSYIMIRTEGDGTDENPFRPRDADLAPYASLSWSDVTGRASDINDGPLYLAKMLQDPRVMIIKATMDNADALTMQSDPKLWMIASRRFDNNMDEIENDFDQTYTAEERQLRINQFTTITGFNVLQISNWWTPDKTRREIALKLRNYLKDLN